MAEFERIEVRTRSGWAGELRVIDLERGAFVVKVALYLLAWVIESVIGEVWRRRARRAEAELLRWARDIVSDGGRRGRAR